MHLHFRYHSQTQRVLHGTPFVLLVCGAGWLAYTTDEPDQLAGIIGALAFTWLFLANFLLNAIVQHRGARLGPIDLTRNVSPTSTERLIGWLILIAALGAGAVAATISVQDVARGGMEAKSLLAGAAFLFTAAAIYEVSTFAIIVLSGFRIRPVRG